MSKETGNGCGTKHFKLACWLIGLFVVIAIAVMTFAAKSAEGYDTRLRIVEQGNVRLETKVDAIKDSVGRIERYIEKGTE